VWAALMTRKLLLIVSAVFAPIAFAGSLGDITASWVRKWIELTVALIASKVILVLIFVVGLGVLDNGVGEATVGGGTSGQVAQSATQLVIGCLILCLAGLAPWMAIKLVHFTGDSFHQIHSYAQAVQGAGQQVVAVPQKLTQHAQRLATGSPSSSSSKSPTSPRTESSTETIPDPGGTENLSPAGIGGSEVSGEGAGGIGVAAGPVVGATAAKGAGQAGAAKLVDVGSGQPSLAPSDEVGSSTAGNGSSPSGQLPQRRSELSSSSEPPEPSQPG
jgi:type IV secretion system protein TrbL